MFDYLYLGGGTLQDINPQEIGIKADSDLIHIE